MRSWASQLPLWPHFLICKLGVQKWKIPKTHSTGLTLFETSLGIPGFGQVVGNWLGSALFLAGGGRGGEEELLVTQAFLFFPPPHVLLLSLSHCHQPQEAARSSSGSRQAPCPYHTAELVRGLWRHAGAAIMSLEMISFRNECALPTAFSSQNLMLHF